MEIFFFWILLSIFVGVYASNKKTSLGGIPTFIISLVLSPIIGFIIVLISKPSESEIILSGEMKKCPKCAELVKNEAVKCRYCGETLELPASMILQKHMDKVDEYEEPGRVMFKIVGGVIIVSIIIWIISNL